MIASERTVRILGCVAALGCAPKPHAQEEMMPSEVDREEPPVVIAQTDGVSPRWRVGEGWDVRYRVKIDSWKKVADAPREIVQYDWRYEVEGVADDGIVDVMTKASNRDPWRMRFAGPGRLLSVTGPDQAFEAPDDAPFVPLGMGGSFDPLATQWPRFPLRAGASDRAKDDSWEQNVSQRGGTLTVTFVGRGEVHGGWVERTVVQEWEEHKPWWSSTVVRVKTVFNEKVEEDLEIEGHVTAWRLREDR